MKAITKFTLQLVTICAIALTPAAFAGFEGPEVEVPEVEVPEVEVPEVEVPEVEGPEQPDPGGGPVGVPEGGSISAVFAIALLGMGATAWRLKKK